MIKDTCACGAQFQVESDERYGPDLSERAAHQKWLETHEPCRYEISDDLRAIMVKNRRKAYLTDGEASASKGVTRLNWIEYDGRGAPSADVLVLVQKKNGELFYGEALDLHWRTYGLQDDIARYTIIEP